MLEIELEVQKLNERGYGVGYSDGKEYWILNSLPGERVTARIHKKKKGVWYGIAIEIQTKSKLRNEPKEEHFLSCSPWQIITPKDELTFKKELIKDFYRDNANIKLPEFDIYGSLSEYHYRNKLEFSFYGFEDETLKLAYHKRDGAKAKYPIDNCALAPTSINNSNKRIVEFLNYKGIQARQLKGLLNRYSFYEGKVVSALYVKDENLNFEKDEIETLLDDNLKGIVVIYSTHKSPALVETKILLSVGETDLVEKILDKYLAYPYDGFFQINPVVFEETARDILEFLKNLGTSLSFKSSDFSRELGTGDTRQQTGESKKRQETSSKENLKFEIQDLKVGSGNCEVGSMHNPGLATRNSQPATIKQETSNQKHVTDEQSQINNFNTPTLTLTDLYSGVGTLGILASPYVNKVIGIELFDKSKFYAEKNIRQNSISNMEFIQDKAEKEGLNVIENVDIVIVDPPRSGLHPKLTKKLLTSFPEYIIYLSCNPKTQAQDFNHMKDIYEIEFIKAYNYFSHTPHVENLLILKRRDSK